MKLTKEDKIKILEEYLKWVDDVCEECDWKTSFSPEEIVYKVIEIVEDIK